MCKRTTDTSFVLSPSADSTLPLQSTGIVLVLLIYHQNFIGLLLPNFILNFENHIRPDLLIHIRFLISVTSLGFIFGLEWHLHAGLSIYLVGTRGLYFIGKKHSQRIRMSPIGCFVSSLTCPNRAWTAFPRWSGRRQPCKLSSQVTTGWGCGVCMTSVQLLYNSGCTSPSLHVQEVFFRNGKCSPSLPHRCTHPFMSQGPLGLYKKISHQ
jgi:hypothetical protein